MNEQEKFLDGLQEDVKTVDLLDQPIEQKEEAPEKEDKSVETEVTSEKKDTPDDDIDTDDLSSIKPKNRRERRLIKKITDERESAMFMAGQLKAVKEAEKSVTEESDFMKSIERIYGNDTPEAAMATELLKKGFAGVREEARKLATEDIRAERSRELEDQKDAEKELDGIVEDLEDTYGIDLSPAHQKAYFTLLEKMSPKDSSGNVTSYADSHAVWEMFQERLRKPNNSTAKNLSARSMVQTGAPSGTSPSDDADANWLSQHGII